MRYGGGRYGAGRYLGVLPRAPLPTMVRTGSAETVRDPLSSLGPDWTVDAGNWSIVNGKLQCTDTGNQGAARIHETVGNASESGVIEVQVGGTMSSVLEIMGRWFGPTTWQTIFNRPTAAQAVMSNVLNGAYTGLSTWQVQWYGGRVKLEWGPGYQRGWVDGVQRFATAADHTLDGLAGRGGLGSGSQLGNGQTSTFQNYIRINAPNRITVTGVPAGLTVRLTDGATVISSSVSDGATPISLDLGPLPLYANAGTIDAIGADGLVYFTYTPPDGIRPGETYTGIELIDPGSSVKVAGLYGAALTDAPPQLGAAGLYGQALTDAPPQIGVASLYGQILTENPPPLPPGAFTLPIAETFNESLDYAFDASAETGTVWYELRRYNGVIEDVVVPPSGDRSGTLDTRLWPEGSYTLRAYAYDGRDYSATYAESESFDIGHTVHATGAARLPLLRGAGSNVAVTGDEFVGALGVDLADHVAGDGTSWALESATPDGSATLTGDGWVAQESTGPAVYLSSAGAPSAHYDVEADAYVEAADDGVTGIVARGTDGGDGYACVLDGAAGEVRLLRLDAGVPTVLGGTAFAPTLGETYHLRLQPRGEVLTATLSGGDLGSPLSLVAVDATYSAPGRLGVYFVAA